MLFTFCLSKLLSNSLQSGMYGQLLSSCVLQH